MLAALEETRPTGHCVSGNETLRHTCRWYVEEALIGASNLHASFEVVREDWGRIELHEVVWAVALDASVPRLSA